MLKLAVDTEHPVVIPAKAISLDGILHVPKQTKGVVLFVHGSGSSRFSARNQAVARELNEAHLATLLFDLLTPAEEELDEKTRELRFDIDLLTERLLFATDWIREIPITHELAIGYFGASTGAAAALLAAAQRPQLIKAVVSRGGRPDLAGSYLSKVLAPTLFIVGSHDETVLQLNEQAMQKVTATKQLEIVEGATHLFEEPGALGVVARLAKAWFLQWLH